MYSAACLPSLVASVESGVCAAVGYVAFTCAVRLEVQRVLVSVLVLLMVGLFFWCWCWRGRPLDCRRLLTVG